MIHGCPNCAPGLPCGCRDLQVFRHWSKDPLVPYANCSCSTCVEILEQLDPGIRHLVIDLREAGFNTTDSGDGVSKPAEWYACGEAMPFPHVAISTTPALLFREAERLADMMDKSWKIQASYDPRDGSAIILVSQYTP